MTLEELCEIDDPSIWEKLTEEQMLKIFSPAFNVTRPELAAKEPKKERQSSVMQRPMPVMTAAKRAMLKQLEEEGCDLSFLGRRR